MFVTSRESPVQQAPRTPSADATVLFCNRNTGNKLVVTDVHLFERSHKFI